VAINRYFRSISSLAKRGAMTALLGSMTTLLVSCGGGGTQGGDPTASGALAVIPNSGSLYANVPQLFNVAGGRGPYLVVSNEQTVVPINATISTNTFTVVPNQPGVVDPQSDPNVVPSRTVIITVRDSAGTQVNGTYNVLQNFLTGYNLSISTITTCTPSAGAAAAAAQACAGADSLIQLVPVSNGVRYANKQMRLTSTFGPFSFILDSTGVTGGTYNVTADSTGLVTARIRVTANAATQYAQFRLTDVATGSYREFTFVVTNSTGSNTELSALPATITLTGANNTRCGTGTVNIFAIGGTPPYTANTTFPGSISIMPPSVLNSGDAFSVSLFNPGFCLAPGNVVIRDATGAIFTVNITTSLGTGDPILPLAVAPSTLCIPDGGSGVASISGGNANKVINSSNPGLATAIPTSGNGNFTAAINALGAGGGAGTPVTLAVSDGATTANIAVTRKTTCP